MDPDHVPSDAPTPRAGSHRRRLTLGLTAVALVAGGGVAIAAGQPDTESAPAPAGSKAVGLGGVLHSESVVSDGDGGYVTRLTQLGTIESIDADNLTVVSEDGYKRSWARTSDTVVGGGGWSVSKNDDDSYTVKKKATEELATGDQVLVVGTLTGDEATAQRIASRPDTGEIPGAVLKRFQGESGGMGEGPMKGDRMMKRSEGGEVTRMPGQMGGRMGGSGEDVRRFEFRTGPGGEAGTEVKPMPAEPTPAEPGSITSSGYLTTA